MTKDELEQIQEFCREWLRRADSATGSRLTIPAGGALSRPFELKINGLLTFDNVLILSADDAETGACYAKLIRQPDGLQEVFFTPIEKIAEDSAAASDPAPAPMRATQKRYQETMERVHEMQRRDADKVLSQTIEPNAWWVEKRELDSDERPKYLLFSNGKLLGYSLLERLGPEGKRSGRFHPSEDYFEYADVFAALPQAENDWMEVNAREAYGLTDESAGAYRNRFKELSDRIDAVQLYIEDANGNKIQTSEVRVEDLSRYYEDESERWLHVSSSS